MAITATGDRNRWACITRALRNAWFGEDVGVTEKPPLTLYNEAMSSVNNAGTGYNDLIVSGASSGSVANTTLLPLGAEVPTTKVFNVVDPAGFKLAGVSPFSTQGGLTGSGGITQSSATPSTHNYAGGAVPATATTGTDTDGINGKVWVSEVFIPANQTVTGISFLIGSVGGTDKVVVALFSSAGAIVANSALNSSVTVGTTATFQRVPFTAPVAVKGPGMYFIGVQVNGATAKLRTQAFGDHNTANFSQTFNTLVAITPPTTFTASVGPVAMTY